MIRRLVFALVLVGAAFAGGAAINGPGLAWLQRTFLGGPTIVVDGPSAASPAAPKKPPRQFPTAKAAPLVVDLPRPAATRKAAGPPAAPEPDLLPPESPSAPASALARPEAPPAADPPPSVAQGGPARPSTPDAGLDPAAPAPLDPAIPPKADPVARLASAERREPPEGPPATARDWPEIRRRMKALGVARYSIEAETEGRVRFSCVIPVDGLRAVGHQFEAEGDDEYQAAEAALKRVDLWQATEAR